MRWSEIRQVYPNQWLIIEALEAHTMPDGRRQLDCLAIIETCPDGSVALQKYRHLHQQYPLREFYFVHTSRVELEIRERQWLGVRSSQRGHSEATRSNRLQSGWLALRTGSLTDNCYLNEMQGILGRSLAGVKYFNSHDPLVFGIIQNNSIDLKRFLDLHA